VTGGATETVSGGETRTITGGATETITGGETRTVSGGISETVDGSVTLTVNGTVVRIVSGTDIRITGGGRIEIVNAVDAKVVVGPSITVVGGPKIVFAPTIIKHAITYTINTINLELNANVVIYRTPTITLKTENHDHWRLTRYEIDWGRAGSHGQAYDGYGYKLQVCRLFWSANGFFTNLAVKSRIHFAGKYVIGFVEYKQFLASRKKTKAKFASGSIFVRTN